MVKKKQTESQKRTRKSYRKIYQFFRYNFISNEGLMIDIALFMFLFGHYMSITNYVGLNSIIEFIFATVSIMTFVFFMSERHLKKKSTFNPKFIVSALLFLFTIYMTICTMIYETYGVKFDLFHKQSIHLLFKEIMSLDLLYTLNFIMLDILPFVCVIFASLMCRQMEIRNTCYEGKSRVAFSRAKSF